MEIGYEPYLAHVNHNLRSSESQQEEDWVWAFAQKNRLPLEVLRLDKDSLVGSDSLQAQARRLRYAWMESLLDKHNIPWGVTAHTREDDLETLLYQFFRGGDMWMLKGIPYRRGRWLRPLLEVHRSEIVAYLRQRGANEYRLDSSNYEPKYLRNVIRWRVLTALRRIHPEAGERLWERYEIYRLQRHRLEKVYQRLAARYVREEPFGGHIRSGLAADSFFWILREWAGLSWRQGQEAYRLYREGRTGAFLQAGEVTFCRVPAGLEWGHTSLWSPDWPDLLIAGPGTYEWGLWRITVQPESSGRSHEVRLPVTLFPFRLRLWRRGDRIAPTGLNSHSKRLSDVWPAIGLYGFRRKHAFVLEDRTGTLCYAVAYRPHWRIPLMNGPFLYLSYDYVQRDKTVPKSLRG